jgi:hypothetical protein
MSPRRTDDRFGSVRSPCGRGFTARDLAREGRGQIEERRRRPRWTTYGCPVLESAAAARTYALRNQATASAPSGASRSVCCRFALPQRDSTSRAVAKTAREHEPPRRRASDEIVKSTLPSSHSHRSLRDGRWWQAATSGPSSGQVYSRSSTRRNARGARRATTRSRGPTQGSPRVMDLLEASRPLAAPRRTFRPRCPPQTSRKDPSAGSPCLRRRRDAT